ncbi:type II secretion system protein [Paraherbaspirillum soli]|uniref:Type II secretion system protein n=1 Tax=Paraherbaspirillum soli TaxID=631222 RepID=A0ABW0M646_9BURK
MKINQHYPRRARGVVLLALLLTLALMAIALMGAANWWAFERQRQAEEQLLFVGDQYRMAIAHYYYATPGPAKALPLSLADLLEDHRFPVPVRHLRRLYLDPITEEPFELLHSDEQIYGVASTSTKQTIKRAGFSPRYRAFEGLETYKQWQFSFSPARLGKAPALAPPKTARPIKK